jgi:hypothetical protein
LAETAVRAILWFMDSRPTPRRLPPHLRPSRLSPEFIDAAASGAEPPKRETSWWRPLTNRWGLLGIIIFIGLVKFGIDGVVRWFGR